MYFHQALNLMKKGKKISRPHWKGYWVWDNVYGTIMMHTKDGDVIDIFDTKRKEYTLYNIACEDFIVVKEEKTVSPTNVPKESIDNIHKYIKNQEADIKNATEKEHEDFEHTKMEALKKKSVSTGINIFDIINKFKECEKTGGIDARSTSFSINDVKQLVREFIAEYLCKCGYIKWSTAEKYITDESRINIDDIVFDNTTREYRATAVISNNPVLKFEVTFSENPMDRVIICEL